MHVNSMKLMLAFREKYLDVLGKPLSVLDVGAMHKNGSYKELFKDYRYVGMDVEEGKNVDVVCPKLYHWDEIVDGSFDAVISGQCLEHVPMPWRWIQEVNRVVKKGGIIIILAPWQWKPHYYPVDCWRWLPDGATGLFEDFGFEMLETGMSDNDTYAIGRKI